MRSAKVNRRRPVTLGDKLSAALRELNAERTRHNETRAQFEVARLTLDRLKRMMDRAYEMRSQLYIAKQLGDQLSERVKVIADAFGQEFP